MHSTHPIEPLNVEAAGGPTLLDLLVVLAENVKLLLLGPLFIGICALGITYLMTPEYTARTVILPPQQQGSAISTALQSLGPLAGLAGSAGGLKNPADQYAALLQSTTVSNRIIDAHKLMEAYKSSTRQDARERLASTVRFGVGKKDGLITIEVDDIDAPRAAAIANGYVLELRKLTNELALTEAQQRRAFFEQQLQGAKARLSAAQQALQGSGINEGALRAEPKAAADTYAALRAQVTAAEVRIQSMRGFLTEQAPEFRQAQAVLAAAKSQLGKAEASNQDAASSEYVSRYREFKYQEALFELFAKQYELAKLDESREGATIQVVDVATVPEKRSKPQRAYTAVVATLFGGFVVVLFVLIRAGWRFIEQDPANAQRLLRLKQSWRRG